MKEPRILVFTALSFRAGFYRFSESRRESVAALVVSAPSPLVEVSGIAMSVLSAVFWFVLDEQPIMVIVPATNTRQIKRFIRYGYLLKL
jgi:hypothetical protein